MFQTIKDYINTGRYELKELTDKINTLWVESQLTDEEREALLSLAQENADYTNSVDVIKKLEEHDLTIRSLEERILKLEQGEPTEPTEPVEAPEYVDGKWYYNGNIVTFKGKKYKCIAPQGQVCTWSPEAYPMYWELVEE